MKSLFAFFAFIALVTLAVWFFFFRKKTATGVNNTSTTGNVNTAGGFASWFPGWNGFTTSSLNNVTSSVTTALAGLKSISNAFGFNDGGTNPGVSTGGSAFGGISSSGSGAGIPVDDSFFDFGSSVPVSQLYSTPVGLNGQGNTSDYTLWGF